MKDDDLPEGVNILNFITGPQDIGIMAMAVPNAKHAGLAIVQFDGLERFQLEVRLTPANARRLANWLNKWADAAHPDGAMTKPKRRPRRPQLG